MTGRSEFLLRLYAPLTVSFLFDMVYSSTNEKLDRSNFIQGVRYLPSGHLRIDLAIHRRSYWERIYTRLPLQRSEEGRKCSRLRAKKCCICDHEKLYRVAARLRSCG